MESYDISIIIPSKNNDIKLKKLIESIKKNKNINFEIIVIDNFSNDNTLEYCNEMNVKILQNNFKRAKAKNYGAKISKSNYLLFLDSDMEISNNLLYNCIEMLKIYDALCIKEKSIGNFLISKIRNFEISGNFYDPYLNVARCFRREIFLKCNGYDESLEAGEDLMLQKCLLNNKINLGWIDSGIVHDESNLNLIQFLKKQKLYSQYLKTIKKDEFWLEVISLRRRLKNLKKSVKNNGFIRSFFLLFMVFIFRIIEIMFMMISRGKRSDE
jgi:glycosyltransferase involved in cell wall biosynthesis